MLRDLFFRLRSFVKRDSLERDMEEELRAHLQSRADDLARSGLPRAEAERRARIEFGSREKFKEECREALGTRLLDSLLQDLRFAFRMLRKSPAFTFVAILTLALGIGANTAIFSAVNGVLLNSLPYPHPEQLVSLAETLPPFQQFAISYPNFLDWTRMNHTFQALAAYRQNNFNLTGSGEAQRVKATQVSAGFFSLLGANPLIGRSFSSDEDKPGARPVVMLSESLWKNKFGGSPDILGKQLTLDGAAYTIIGIVPRSFYFCCESTNFRLGDIYLPLGAWNVVWMRDRGAHPGIFAVGRLKPGVTLEEARLDMNGVAVNLAALYPNDDKNAHVALVSLKERMIENVRPMLLVLLVAVGLVLVIGCVNVANLLMARSNARAGEFALRTALGASRGRIFRQLFAESTLLGALGGALGLFLALWGSRAGLALAPESLPRSSYVHADSHVLAFTIAVSLLSGLLFGLGPVLLFSRSGPQDRLKDRGTIATGTSHRVQGAFIVVEMALAVVLLTGAGLAIRTLERLWAVNPGFDDRNVLTFTVALPPSVSKESPDQIRATVDRLAATVASIPGIIAASITDGAFPMAGDDEVGFWIEGSPKPPTERELPNALNYLVGPGYLKTMAIPLRSGRFFSAQDGPHTPFVVVIDENFARQYFPDRDPLGRHIHLAGIAQPFEIIGVVAHAVQRGLDENQVSPANAQVYNLVTQIPDEYISFLAKAEGFVVRTETPNYPSGAAVRQAIEKMNSEQVAYDFQSMRELLSNSLAARRFMMILLCIFAAFAVFLASIGIYGVVSYVAASRTREIGIRVALGAERGHVLRLVLAYGAKLGFLGVALGLCAAFVLTRLTSALLFGVSARDPWTFLGVAALLSFVGLVACYIPARRATRIDPLAALRHE